PFELVGFSRNGALSKGTIRPYDRRGAGFIAGEGGGLVVLKRLEDAQRDGDAIYATLKGWGLSSDGRAGIMQPVAKQQAAAIERAVAGAGCKVTDLDFVEGHGTGTRAGDRTEIEGMSLAMALESGGGDQEDHSAELERTCGIGSLKSIIGHTKAAAGVASLIKAVAAVNRRVVPPTAGVEEPNDAFSEVGANLFPIRLGEAREPDTVVRAGVSAFGFGGINTHLIIESNEGPSPKLAPDVDERALLASYQASELFVFAGNSKDELLASIHSVASEAPLLSQSDLVDLAAMLAKDLPAEMQLRAAVIATGADDLTDKLSKLSAALGDDASLPDNGWASPHKDVYVASGTAKGRIGF
ncbi:MAG: ketoacyl-synthetase C-terminal extension domain-containing protein, partial [Cyanobacteria bacterium J06648_11]